MEVEASPARFAAEVDAGRDMLARASDRFGHRPKRVAIDTAYGSAAVLAFVRERGATPQIPVLDRTQQTTSMFPRDVSAFDRERDRYVCPDGKALTHLGFDRQVALMSTARVRPTAKPARRGSDARPGRAAG